MHLLRLIPSVLTGLLVSTSALAIVPSSSRVDLYGPAVFNGEESGASADLLPRGVSGLLPEADGGAFALEVETGLYGGGDERSIRAALSEILPAVGFRGEVGALEIGRGATLARPDATRVAAQRASDTSALIRAIEAEHGEVTDTTMRVIEYQADENEAMMLAPRTVVRVVQSVGGLPARGLGLSVRVDADGYITGISGALTDLDRLDGSVRVEAGRAQEIARETLARYEDVEEIGEAEALAIPTAGVLRPAWRVEVTTKGRWYAVTVDAETGDLLGVADETETLASGEGRAFTPDPMGTDYDMGFSVYDAVDKKFVLDNDVATVTTYGGDGCDTDPVSVSSAGGYANFDVSPINSTNVNDATDPNYNCRFQEVNAFVRVQETLYWFEGLGAEPSPHVPVRVNLGNACNDGPDQACAGGGMLTMGIGSATLSGGSMGLLNTALDQTVITHELGHHVHSRQVKLGGGLGHGSLSEGLADYFAMAEQDWPTVADYTGLNTGFYVQTGGLPRQAEDLDVFPEHFDIGWNESHSNGQMAAWAAWSFRTEMGDRGPLGEGLATRVVLAALTCSGYGITNDQKTEQEVYGAFQSLLSCELLETGYAQARVDVLQAWARAGVFTTAHEAIIDISDDYLSPNDPAPTFTVWPGQDFSFSGGDASDSTNYNKNFEIELASDATFTTNLVSSGPQTGFAEVGGNTRATWTPTAKQWESLKEGSLLYYRVRTWDDEGGKKRDSEHTMAGFMQVPTAVAVINGGGSAGCSSAGGRTWGWFGALVGMAALLRRRSA